MVRVGLVLFLSLFSLVGCVQQVCADSSDIPVTLASHGARFTIIPDPYNGKMRVLPLGYLLPEFQGLKSTITINGKTYIFPPRPNAPYMIVDQTITPVSVQYVMRIPDMGADFIFEITSPFCPDLSKWRSAPLMFLKFSVRNNSDVMLNTKIAFQPALNLNAQSTQGSIVGITSQYDFFLDQSVMQSGDVQAHIAPHLKPENIHVESAFTVSGHGEFVIGALQDQGWTIAGNTLVASIDLEPGDIAQRTLAMAFYTASPILKIDGKLSRFAYVETFKSAVDVVPQGLKDSSRIENSNASFIRMLLPADFGPEGWELIAVALQSYFANTWLAIDSNGALRYSEWEGFPRFHSTIDVVYNNALFHVMFTPDLLGNLLTYWHLYAQDGHLPHDIGKGLVIDRNRYPIRMTVEEDTNYLLMHILYANFTGDDELLKTHFPFLANVIRNLLNSDSDDDGLPDKGVINTFDDAPYSVNASKNQLYLGVKQASALSSFLEYSPSSRLLPDSLKKKMRAGINRILSVMESSWLGDHYPIHLGKQSGKSRVLIPCRPGTQAQIHVSGPDNADGFSNYIAHGLPPLLLSGNHALSVLYHHLARHLTTSHNKTGTLFGDAHRDGQTNVWVSQNMWRDIAAAYLNAEISVPRLHGKYLELQKHCYRKRLSDPRQQGFCDSPVNSFLTSYSRGTSVVMYPWAKRLFSFSRSAKVLTMNFQPKDVSLPIPFLADWKTGRVPVITRIGDRLEISEHPELLQDFKLLTLPNGLVTVVK